MGVQYGIFAHLFSILLTIELSKLDVSLVEPYPCMELALVHVVPDAADAPPQKLLATVLIVDTAPAIPEAQVTIALAPVALLPLFKLLTFEFVVVLSITS